VAPLSCQEFISRRVGASSIGILDKKSGATSPSSGWFSGPCPSLEHP
jgi:hypothetical protein